MRSLERFSKGLLVAGMLAASAVSGCGPDYSLFKVTVKSDTSPRNQIEDCYMSITDENGKTVLDGYRLKPVYGPADSSGNPTLAQGCEGGLTTPNIGVLSYSSSRTTGTLTFTVNAWDNGGQACGFKVGSGCTPVQTGSSAAATPVVYKGPANEVPVAVDIKAP